MHRQLPSPSWSMCHRMVDAASETMECLPKKKLPTGGPWTYELKLDGFRVEAIRTVDRANLVFEARQRVSDLTFTDLDRFRAS